MHESSKGSYTYTPLTLKFYDWWVLYISNSYAWRCKTKPVLLNHYQQHMRRKHLDIGVGTGFYLARTLKGIHDITLMDLNNTSLKVAKDRVGLGVVSECILHDVLQPLPSNLHNTYDSISLFYLLHCLPGSMLDKKEVISHVASVVKKDGVVYGSTVLGDGVRHNAFGRMLMNIYNKQGIFSNRQDSLDSLHEALSYSFSKVDIKLHGTVALFAAHQKINKYEEHVN